MAATHNAGVANGLGVEILGTVEAATMYKVEDDGGILTLGEGVAVKCATLRCGHLGEDVVACEGHRVVARLYDLLCAVCLAPEACRVVTKATTAIDHLTHNGHECYIEQVAAART